MIRLFVLAIPSLLLGAPAQAQPDDRSAMAAEQAVRETIDALLEGMRAGDSGAVRAMFADSAQVHALTKTGDMTGVRGRSADAFAVAVGQPRDAVWDERVWDVEIRVDGPMATAWMPYVFYLGDEFSHCGVNAIHLVSHSDGWRIHQITYTRRQDCDVPAEVRK